MAQKENNTRPVNTRPVFLFSYNGVLVGKFNVRSVGFGKLPDIIEYLSGFYASTVRFHNGHPIYDEVTVTSLSQEDCATINTREIPGG